MTNRSFLGKIFDRLVDAAHKEQVGAVQQHRALALQNKEFLGTRFGWVAVNISPEKAAQRVAECDTKLAQLDETARTRAEKRNPRP